MDSKTVFLVANGDLRLSANQKCTPAQLAMEAKLSAVIEGFGYSVVRAHSTDRDGHCFIDSQKMGMAIFRCIPPTAPVIVAEAVWQYSQHILAGLMAHRRPILTVANWSGEWPGLVGMLNLNGSLTKAGVPYCTLWSENFDDPYFTGNLLSWLSGKSILHKMNHVRAFRPELCDKSSVEFGRDFARRFKGRQAIMGVFDEGCMGMFNAIIPDALLNPLGVFKERLSQSALFHETMQVTAVEAREALRWMVDRGLKFVTTLGQNALTDEQLVTQGKMYIAAMRIADDFGCDTIGIQYQQGLKDLLPASDLVEGMLNNCDRPPVMSRDKSRILYEGEALPHFNEVDECAGLDGLVTYRLWRELGFSPENTLHDLRWGRHYKGPGTRADGSLEVDAYVWVFEISGAAPPEHFIGGWRGASSERQPAMYFRLGGGTLKGISKPGYIVWSRIFIEGGYLYMDIGLGEVVGLPLSETEERWNLTTPQWPIMHAVLSGVTRDGMMGRHKSNHIQVVYAPSRADAENALVTKAAAMNELGIKVSICGTF